MHKVIDTPWNAAPHADALKAAGVQTVLRYYNRQNSTRLPEKRIEKDEADALADAGLKLAVVFQQRGGAGGNLSDLDAQSGASDAARALDCAARIGQPEGSAIYFAVDHDFWKPADLDKIEPYFAAVRTAFAGKYRIGTYGSGTIGRVMREAGHADLIWLAAAKGWSGTRDMLETDAWALFQHWPPLNDPLPHDGNVISPAWHDYGQFTPGATGQAPPVERAPRTTMMEVVARSGLKVRRGPGTGFEVETSLATGALVHALGRTGDWVQVDLQGDGIADGFMHGDYLRVVSGGLPAPIPEDCPGARTPYAIALAELALDVRELPGAGNNPRIVTYHNSTTATAGTADAVAWCSSFVNYCVEQAGLEGTDSQWALSWEHWGRDASLDPQEGDIVVWERVGQGGHVGFFREDTGERISVLGGNQSNRVKVSSYPKDGDLAGQRYKLRAIRRA